MYIKNYPVFSKRITGFFNNHGLYDQKVFNYLKNHTIMFDYDMDHSSSVAAMGFAPKFKKNSKVLEKFTLCMPYPNDAKTLLMNVNIISKGIVAYGHLNKKFNFDVNLEAIGFLYEELFAKESNDPSIVAYKNHIDRSIIEDEANMYPEMYRYALYAQNQLLEENNNDINEMESLSLNLLKKYKKEHK